MAIVITIPSPAELLTRGLRRGRQLVDAAQQAVETGRKAAGARLTQLGARITPAAQDVEAFDVPTELPAGITRDKAVAYVHRAIEVRETMRPLEREYDKLREVLRTLPNDDYDGVQKSTGSPKRTVDQAEVQRLLAAQGVTELPRKTSAPSINLTRTVPATDADDVEQPKAA